MRIGLMRIEIELLALAALAAAALVVLTVVCSLFFDVSSTTQQDLHFHCSL
jgi:hypothetical protein